MCLNGLVRRGLEARIKPMLLYAWNGYIEVKVPLAI
jgi:hypothetical protein